MEILDKQAGPDQAYADALRAGRFQIQRCVACRAHVFYPRELCPECGARHLEWIQASGRATVYSTTVVRRKPESGGDYNVSLVDLAEGPRMMSRVEGISPENVRIGMQVKAEIRSEAGAEMVVYVPLEGGSR